MNNPSRTSAESAKAEAGPDGHGRDLELALARERDAVEQVRLLERQLLESERSAARAAQLEHDIEAATVSHDRHVADLRRQIEQLHEEVERVRIHNADLQRQNRELDATAAHFRAVNEGIMSSLSWRVTRPLRALKALRG